MRKIATILILPLLLLTACSSPFAGPDAFDIGLANAMQLHAQMALTPRTISAPMLAPLPPVPPLQSPYQQAPRKHAVQAKPKAKPVKRFADEPDDDGRFLPLPVEDPAPAPKLAEPSSLGGAQ